VNALFRSREAAAPAAARVLFDPYAHLFAERHPLVAALRGLRWLLPPLRRLIDELQTAHCVRHRSIDQLCLDAARDGFQQIVVLGAGYDTRPLRLGPPLPHVRWFEVDHPATATRKARLWRRSGLHTPARQVPLDLEREPLAPALRAAGFDPGAPSCFVLEGLAHYLARPSLARLLAAAGAGPGRRRIVLSFIRPDMARAAPALFVTLVRLLREIPTTHLDRPALDRLAHPIGLHVRAHFTFADQVHRLLPVAPARQPQLSQDIAVLDAPDAADPP
jgi:methyltransferase (TIGR00027 family)